MATTTTQQNVAVNGNCVSGIMVVDKGPYSFTVGDGFVEFCRRNSIPAWEGEEAYETCKRVAFDAVAAAHNAGRILSIKFGTKWERKDLRWQPHCTVRRECNLPAEQHAALVARAIQTAEKRHSEQIALMRKYSPAV